MKHELARLSESEDSLANDFGLIFEAVADAFRGLALPAEPDCGCTKLHYASWR